MGEASVRTYPTRHGPMLALVHDRFVTRSLAEYGEYCPAEWKLLEQLVKPGMTVVELGANIGTHTVPMARLCAPGRLWAFEPQPRVFQVLCANLALNDIGNVLAYPDAGGEAEGFAVMPQIDYGVVGNFGGVGVLPEAARGVRVRITPLDSLPLPACHVLKIDVEGSEPAVLRGAARTIAKFRPLIYIENDRHDQQQEVISLIAGQGYRLHWHLPRLFSADNFNGAAENVFGGLASVNMLCIPAERNAQVDMPAIDPDNWTTPIPRRA
jgi:FkbM family methyltransferase